MEGVTLHSARHTVATMLYEATGRNLKAVQEILGHASIAMTARYLHTTSHCKRDAIGALDYGTGRKSEDDESDRGIIKFPAASTRPENAVPGDDDDFEAVGIQA